MARAHEVLAASWSSWSFVRKSTNVAKLQSLAFPVDTPKAEPVYQSYRQGQNGRRVVRRKRVVKYQNLKNLLNLNLNLVFKAIQSYLNFSKDIDALRDTKSIGECSFNSCVQENREDLLYDPETDEIIRNLDLKRIIHPSPSQGSSIDCLFSEELEDSNSPLSDIFNLLASQKNSIVYDLDQKFDFTAGILNPTILKEFGLNQENVNLVSKGLKVNLTKELDYSKLKPKPNNCNLVRNRPIVR